MRLNLARTELQLVSTEVRAVLTFNPCLRRYSSAVIERPFTGADAVRGAVL